MSDMKTPSNEGLRLIKNWKKTKDNVASQEEALKHKKQDLQEAKNELAEFLFPSNAAVRSQTSFCIWCVDTLIEAKYDPLGIHEITVVEEGKFFREL